MALEIQQSINQMLSSAGTMAGIYKAITEPERVRKKRANEAKATSEKVQSELVLDEDLKGLAKEADTESLFAHKAEYKRALNLMKKHGELTDEYIPGYAQTQAKVEEGLAYTEQELKSRLQTDFAAKQSEAKIRDMILNPQKYPKEVR